MKKDSLSYNPKFLYNDSISWFGKFILLQDEVPSGMLKIQDDSIFLKNRIVQVKIEKPKSLERSMFSSHLLAPSSAVAKEKPVNTYGWVSVIIMLCVFLFAFTQYNYFKRMQQIFKAFFANRLFSQFSREGGLFSERASFFLFISYLAGLSLFFYNVYVFYFDPQSSALMSFWLYIKILTGVTLFYIFKMGVFNLSGFIFKSGKEISDYVLNIYVSAQVTGVALLPVIILTTFIHYETIIIAGSVLFVLLYVYSLFRGAVYAIYNSKISVYYLFLYLCTLEILPLFLFVKIFNVLD